MRYGPLPIDHREFWRRRLTGGGSRLTDEDAPQKIRRLLEVCVDTPEDAVVAAASGADRIELCAALELGGLTPSFGLIRAARVLPLPVSVMIRPRGGNFIYGPDEIDVMRRDIDVVRAEGLSGVVFGAQNSSGALDLRALELLAEAAAGLQTTLHRAFDLVPNLPDALELAIGLGFTRVLTSGGRATAAEGAEVIADLVAQGGRRIVVMPGSGVAPQNARALILRTGALEIHGSCSLPAGGPKDGLGFITSLVLRRRTSSDLVRAVRIELDRIDSAPL